MQRHLRLEAPNAESTTGWLRGVPGDTSLIFGLASLGLLVLFLTGCSRPEGPPAAISRSSTSLRSPNGLLQITVNLQKTLAYNVRFDGTELVANSRLGLQLRDGIQLGEDVNLLTAEHRSGDETWENRWGKRRHMRDHYNELRVVLQDRRPQGRVFEVIFRAYDDGIAFRYALPAQDGLESFVLERERTEFAFGGDYPCFAGQQEKGFQGPQEWEFKPATLHSLTPESIVGLPLLIQTPNAWVAIGESDLKDWAGMWLSGTLPAKGGSENITLETRLAPRFDHQGVVTGDTPLASPWRVLMVGREPGRLIESDLILNLATPCQLADTTWIKPGKMAWDHWWSGDVKMDTATIKEYIQLAADMGWPYQLIDWQWYGPFNQPESDITKVNPAVDMDEVRRFAKEKNVRLWLWLYFADVERNQAFERAFALYQDWGIAGIKIDFMDRDDQPMVQWYGKITQAAAQHHLMVNFHGAYKTAGYNRTYPNQITREGILGNEYNRWSARVTPAHKLTLPFTRFLEGPADFTPGGFLNRPPAQFKADGKAAQVQGTRSAELALFVLYDSPLCCVCDHPSHYRSQTGADFLSIVPTVWDETQVLDGEVGHHLVMVRRSGNQYFLGALTDATAREISLKLDFLPKGRWKLRLWRDAADSADHAEHIETLDRITTSADPLTISMAPAGGCVGWFQPEPADPP